MPRTERKPAPEPKIAQLYKALERAGLVLSRDRYGVTYMAAPRFAGTRFHRIRLDGSSAPSLVRSIWGQAHTGADGYRPAVPMSKALSYEAMAELRARADELAPVPHHQRVARLADGRRIIDPAWANEGRGKSTWRAIELGGKGWRVLSGEPAGALFIRSASCERMAEPVRHARRRDPFAELQALFPTVRGDRMALLLAVMAWSLVSTEDHVMIVLFGRGNAGKSTLARLIRDIIDPNAKPLDPMPSGDAVRNLIVSGAHDRQLVLDNISSLERDVADMLCQRTDGYGGGGRYRTLHTNADLAVVPSSGPVLLTSIVAMLGHADLAERSIVLDVGEVNADGRTALPSTVVEARKAELLPALFGRLLDAAAAGLAGMDKFAAVPGFRNAAFAAFAQAAAPVLGETPAGMAALLSAMGEYTRALAADAAPVASALLDLVAGGPLQEGLQLGLLWKGTAAALLTELAKIPSVRMDAGFPRTGANLQGELIRLQGVLRSAGLRVLLLRRSRANVGQNQPARWIEVWQDNPEAAAAAELAERVADGAPVVN
jgi:hypothetical protein